MSEINQDTSLNLSDSPEYVDVFNDETSTKASRAMCDNSTATGGGILCTGTGATCSLTACTSINACVSTGTTCMSTGSTTFHNIALGFGIAVYTSYVNGTTGYCNSAATTNSWGRVIYARYLGPNRYGMLYSGQTYQFKQVITDAPSQSNYYYFATAAPSNSTCATTMQNTLKTARYDFRITSFDGHEVPYNFYFSGTGVSVLYTSGNNMEIVTFPRLSKTLYISAMTYTLRYSSGTTSATLIEDVRNSKIGTKYTITNVAKNKTATTASGGSYVYSTSYVYNPSIYNLKPGFPFQLQTSAQSVTVNFERIGSVSSGKTIVLSSDNPNVLPIQEGNGRLATLNDISNGLGISAFNNMFNSGTNANFKNIVITPNYYNNVLTTTTYTGTYVTSYKYYKPALFFKAASGATNNNYCLRMNDISAFDKWMYMVGAVSNSSTTYTNNDFNYKNYNSQNVKDNIDWATNSSDLKAYFTLILK